MDTLGVLASMDDIALELGKDALIGALAALFAVRISLRKFSSERWWERQEDAYRGIIESLSRIKFCLLRLNPDDLSTARGISEEESEELTSDLLRQYDELRQRAFEGAFRVSRKTVEAIRNVREYPVTRNGYSVELVETLLNDVDACLAKVDDEAKRELGLTRRSAWLP